MPFDSSLPMEEGRVVVELILPHVLAAIPGCMPTERLRKSRRAALERTDQQRAVEYDVLCKQQRDLLGSMARGLVWQLT